MRDECPVRLPSTWRTTLVAQLYDLVTLSIVMNTLSRKPGPLKPQRDAAAYASRRGWTQDPERVRQDILAVAHEEFVAKGLSGARVDEIAARTKTSKRMIYYYFGDKRGLYRAVLEAAYTKVRSAEQRGDLEALPPKEALAKLVSLTFDYHAENPDFVRLVMIENIHNAEHLKESSIISRLNLSAIEVIRGIYERGIKSGVFRVGLDPLEIHLMMTAPAFYSQSNRASIRQVFGFDMGGSDHITSRRQAVVDMVVRYCKAH
jgi:AcrR family transcriptional regulator